MTTDSWDQVLSTYQAEIYELCNRTLAIARLQDALGEIAENLDAKEITLERAVELAGKAAEKCSAAIAAGQP